MEQNKEKEELTNGIHHQQVENFQTDTKQCKNGSIYQISPKTTSPTTDEANLTLLHDKPPGGIPIGTSTQSIEIHSPDGGYGWVIVIACFFLQAMLDGMFSVFGVFLPQLVDYYEASHGRTAIIGSLLSACMMLSGPFVSVLVGFIGCQKVAMMGGVCITVGLVLSTMAPNLNVVIVTFGLLAGIGLGLIFQPAVVMVGFWFERKRAIAMGISSSGAGFGMLILASVSGALLKDLDWKSSLLIVACIVMQSVVFGALLRPVRYKSVAVPSPSIREHKDTDTEHYTGCDTHEDDTIVRTYSTSSCDRAIYKNTPRKPSLVTHAVTNSAARNHHSYSETIKEKTYPLLPKNGLYLSHQEIPSHIVVHNKKNDLVHSQNELYMSNPLLRKDIFYSGSIHNISKHHGQNQLEGQNTTKSASVLNGGLHSIKSANSILGGKDQNNFTPMKEMLSLHIFKDKSFLIIALANSLMQAGFIICIYFVTHLGISLGIEPRVAAYSVSIFGIGTTVGRASAGAVASIPHLTPAHVTSVSLVIAGVLSICTALLCTNFLSLALCFGFTGFFVAPIIPLTTVILAEYLGIEHLTNAHGMVSLGKGIASLISAPVAGLLMDKFGSYIGPFCITGGLFIAAGLLHCLLFALPKRKNTQHDS